MAQRHVALSAVLTLACCGLFGCGESGKDLTLQGSGATLPAPIYKRWFLEYYKAHPEVRVNYHAHRQRRRHPSVHRRLRSLRRQRRRHVEGRDRHIDEMHPQSDGVYLLPMTAGVIVLSYNLPGITQPIRLSREAYVKIFLREITNWTDDAIARTNPGVKLPDLDITIVTRADSSGTSYAFSNRMNSVAKAINVEWTPTVSKSPKWKEAISAQGNDGVAALIQLTPGAIGYLEFGYAELGHLPMATLENHSHHFIVADAKGVAGRKALEGAKIPDDLQIKVTDPDDKGAYPIATYTWVLCRKKYPAAQAHEVEQLKAVLRFSLEDHQQETAATLGYLRLPDDVIKRVSAALEKITVGS